MHLGHLCVLEVDHLQQACELIDGALDLAVYARSLLTVLLLHFALSEPCEVLPEVLLHLRRVLNVFQYHPVVM